MSSSRTQSLKSIRGQRQLVVEGDNRAADEGRKMDRQRFIFWKSLLIVAMVLLAPLGFVSDLLAEEPELEDLNEYNYEYYYPKRAKGGQPTAWHVPDFDNINLFNGNLTMQIPLGPPLHPGGDLTWQPVLYYNSKIWTDNRRDDRADPTNDHPYHAKGQENRGYLETDRTAGLGWRLAAPFIHLKRVKRTRYWRAADDLELDTVTQWYETAYVTECPNRDECVSYLVDSIVMPDGSRHNLRPGREGWDVSTPPNGENTYWYSSDGSGWKVKRLDRGKTDPIQCVENPVPNQTLDMWDIFIAEKDGLRYTFATPFNIDTDIAVNHQARETDFVAGTRGWYCTKIESMRWPDVSINFSYFQVNSPHPCLDEPLWKWDTNVGDLDAPLISKIQAFAGSNTVQELVVTTSTHSTHTTQNNEAVLLVEFPVAGCDGMTMDEEKVTVVDSVTIRAFEGGGGEAELFIYDFKYLGEGTPNILYAMPISGKSRADVDWGKFANDTTGYANYPRPPGWDSIRSHTHPFPLLQQLSIQSPDTSIDPLVWSFGYDWTTKWDSGNAPAADMCTCNMIEAAYDPVDPENPVDEDNPVNPENSDELYWKYLYTSDDRTGLLSSVTLPNGTEVEYEYSRWSMVKQEFIGRAGRVKGDEILIRNPGGKNNERQSYIKSNRKVDNIYDFNWNDLTFGRMVFEKRSYTAGVNRRIVTDTDGTTLELTEYIHNGLDSPHMIQLPDWGATEEQTSNFWRYMENWYLMMDMSNEVFAGPKPGFPFDFAGVPFPVVESRRVGAGFSQTVVRRHLIADASPPSTADASAIDLSDITISTDLESNLESSYRFDDTVYVFSNGSFFYDADGDEVVTADDYHGNLPLSGRPLQVRYYRGSSMCRGAQPTCQDDEFLWWKPTDDGIGEQNLLRVERYQYTLPLQDEFPASLEDGVSTGEQRYPNVELCSPYYKRSTNNVLFGKDLAYYCEAFPHSVRERCTTTEYLGEDPTAPKTYTATEYTYETDSGDSSSSPMFDENRVKIKRTHDFVNTKPYGNDGWDETLLTLETRIAYEKPFGANLDPWFPSLVASQIATLTPASASASSETVSFDYDCADNRCLLTSKTALANGDGNDVTTWYEYYDTASELNRYGRVKTVTSRSSETVGGETLYSTDITAFDYEYQKLSSKWKLCASSATCDQLQETCEGWSPDDDAPDWTDPVGSCSGPLPAELIGRQTIDPYWRRPTSRTDGNLDGVKIGYDWIGRVTSIDPISHDPITLVELDVPIAATKLEYPDLKTTLVSLEDTDGTMTLVARYSFDGLGRISHSAARREATSDNGYSGHESDFRHKVVFYDGTGTSWAESHWHEWQPGDEPEDSGGPLQAPESLSTVHDHFEKVTVVDPFGRVEQTISSTGGHTLSTYFGGQYADHLVKDLDPVAEMSRTITRSDARGNLVKSWEAKNATATTSSLSSPIEGTLDVMDSFVKSEYSYDVNNRLLDVTVTGRDADNAEVSQVRSFAYDGLGNLIHETYPELGVGNSIEYSDITVRGEPRLVQYKKADGTVANALYHDWDAAGRLNTTWFKNGNSWLLYNANYWGTDMTSHEVGKLVQSTQYNLMQANVSACTANQVEAEGSIAVSHAYTYGGPLGMPSLRTTDMSFGCGGDKGSLQLSLGYEYDIWANVSKVKYPILVQGPACGHPPRPEVSYTWDIAGGLSRVDLNKGFLAKQLMHTIQYDKATGMMTSWQVPAGFHGATSDVVHVVAPDGTRARPLSINASVDGGYVFDSGSYHYSVLGNITKLDGSTVTSSWEYEYDPLSRLTKASSGSIQEYQYDDFGNLTNHAGVTRPIDSATNRLNAAGYIYDDRGNMESQPLDSWTRQLRYDPGNRVISVWATPERGDGFFGFAYDAGGERVLKYRLQGSSSDETAEVVDATFFLRDESGNVLTEFQWLPEPGSPDGQMLRLNDHIYLGRKEIVTLKPVLDSGSSEWSLDYTALVHDHLASTRVEVFDSGSWSSIDFWPYGEFKERRLVGTSSETLENNRRYFTGHEREYVGTASDFSSLEGLDYMHARYYSFNLGRFLSVDPVRGNIRRSQSWNRFAYSNSNPVNIYDPDGREEEGRKSIEEQFSDGRIDEIIKFRDRLVMRLNDSLSPEEKELIERRIKVLERTIESVKGKNWNSNRKNETNNKNNSSSSESGSNSIFNSIQEGFNKMRDFADTWKTEMEKQEEIVSQRAYVQAGKKLGIAGDAIPIEDDPLDRSAEVMENVGKAEVQVRTGTEIGTRKLDKHLGDKTEEQYEELMQTGGGN
jgi:RHS repeat-associated protein